MHTQLTASDGHTFDCWMRPAEGTTKGGIVILQEIFGVTDQLKRVAEHYAGHGFDVAVPALFDRHARDTVIPFDEAPRGRDIMMATRPEETMADTAAAVAALRQRGRQTAVVGFCWGGGLALRAAQTLPVDAAVAFYGTRLKQYLDGTPLRAPILMHCGKSDDHTPPEVMDEVKQALGDKVEIHWYDAGHAFANEARPAVYHADAAELAHERTLDFLNRHLG